MIRKARQRIKKKCIIFFFLAHISGKALSCKNYSNKENLYQIIHSRLISLQENKHMNASPSQCIRDKVVMNMDQ